MSALEARASFSDLLGSMYYTRGPVIIEKKGRPFADDLNMTSGMVLVFPSSVEAYLLKRYKRLARKVQAASDPVKRFVAFFELHQECGLPVRYES